MNSYYNNGPMPAASSFTTNNTDPNMMMKSSFLEAYQLLDRLFVGTSIGDHNQNRPFFLQDYDEDDGNSNNNNGDDTIRLVLDQIKAARRERRPYGRYCSTEVINERQLWPPNFAHNHKKVIAYNLFQATTNVQQQNKKRRYQTYFQGMQQNIEQAALYFPDWIVRVFVFNLSQEQIQELIDVDPSRVEVVECHSNVLQETSARMITRSFPYDDPSVYAFLSRDSDSRFSPRELMAVNEWLSKESVVKSQKRKRRKSTNNNNNNNNEEQEKEDDRLCFHAMRDHKLHLYTTVMGGMYGMKRGCLDDIIPKAISSTRTTMTSLLDKAIQEHPDYETNVHPKGFDQFWLVSYVWPIVQKRAMFHDRKVNACRKDTGAKLCTRFPLGQAPPGSSTTTSDYFVGEVFERPNMTRYACTLECQQSSSLPLVLP